MLQLIRYLTINIFKHINQKGFFRIKRQIIKSTLLHVRLCDCFFPFDFHFIEYNSTTPDVSSHDYIFKKNLEFFDVLLTLLINL